MKMDLENSPSVPLSLFPYQGKSDASLYLFFQLLQFSLPKHVDNSTWFSFKLEGHRIVAMIQLGSGD